MNYHPNGMRMWDTWYLNHKGEVHAFHLQVLEPESHRTQREAYGVGHAVSCNLLDWKELPNALEPGEVGSGEDLNIFTGCVFEREGACYLYYTQRDSRNEGRVQRIALAVSKDFRHFEKYSDNPVIEPDPKYFCNEDNPALWEIVDCRDLIVVENPEGEGYYGFYAARRHAKEMPEGAVIACVYSSDLFHWHHLGPVFTTRRHTIIEVPDVFYMEGRWYMTLLVSNEYGSRDLFEEEELVGGTIYAVSEKIDGPYVEETDNVILGSRLPNGITCRSLMFDGKRYVLYTMMERQGEHDCGGPSPGLLSTPKEYRIIDGKLRAVYADLLEKKCSENLLTEELRTQPLTGCRVLYETIAQWEVLGEKITGQIRTCWNRYQFDIRAETFVYSARICVEEGAAAGVVFKQSDGYSGYGVLLDYKWQKLIFCRMPGIGIIDCRKCRLEYGRSYHLRVVCLGKHYEVYLDDVLYIQCVSYLFQNGIMGLFLDRAKAEFSDIAIQFLDTKNTSVD